MLIRKDALDLYISSNGKHICCSCIHIDEIDDRKPCGNDCKFMRSRFVNPWVSPIEVVDNDRNGLWITKCKFYARKTSNRYKQKGKGVKTMSINQEKKELYEYSKCKHICCTCIHANEVEYLWGTTWDCNSCQLIQDRYVKDADDPIETVDNGEGYWITKCRFYEYDKDWNKPNYYEYMNSPEWKAKREERLKHDKFQCQMCHTAKNLVVHHITYDRLGHEDLSDLITLCKKCHESVHEKDLENKRHE